MLYFLLIIIAIGVLLASEAGQELLGILWKGALVAGGLYLGFWIIVLITGLLSDKTIRDNIVNFFKIIIFTGIAIFAVYKFYQKCNWENKGAKIFIILIFVFILWVMIANWNTQI
jgi:hypothetical protein